MGYLPEVKAKRYVKIEPEEVCAIFYDGSPGSEEYCRIAYADCVPAEIRDVQSLEFVRNENWQSSTPVDSLVLRPRQWLVFIDDAAQVMNEDKFIATYRAL